MRAYFGLKRVIMRSKLSFKALTILFDSLIRPIILYGAPIWTPNSTVGKLISKSINDSSINSSNFLRQIARSPQEKIHLSFLKWALGVHRKASNVGVWGETGRFPLIYQSIRFTLNYFKRIKQLDPSSFVAAALREQKSLKLSWFNNVTQFMKLDEIYSLDHVTAYRLIQRKPHKHSTTSNKTISSNILSNTLPAKPLKSRKFRTYDVVNQLTTHFTQCWENCKSMSPKLAYTISITLAKQNSPANHTCITVKVSRAATVLLNLELVPMIFKLKQGDIITFLEIREFATGVKLAWMSRWSRTNLTCYFTATYTPNSVQNLLLTLTNHLKYQIPINQFPFPNFASKA